MNTQKVAKQMYYRNSQNSMILRIVTRTDTLMLRKYSHITHEILGHEIRPEQIYAHRNGCSYFALLLPPDDMCYDMREQQFLC
jgi:hypothetical protein